MSKKTKRSSKDKKKKQTKKSKLIGKGSYGCVFKPLINCKNKKNKTQKNKISKIIINEEQKSIDREYQINKMIQKIPNYKTWAYVWDNKCRPPEYDKIKEISEIQKCLTKFKKDKKDYNKYANMLIGDYGGKPFLNYCYSKITKSDYTSQKFIKIFKFLFNLIEPLFIGLISLKKNNLLHQDLSINNIMIKKNKCYMIDFGLSCKFSDKECIKKRSKKQVIGSRIYDPYPYDYIFLFSTKYEREQEIKQIKYDIFREIEDSIIDNYEADF